MINVTVGSNVVVVAGVLIDQSYACNPIVQVMGSVYISIDLLRQIMLWRHAVFFRLIVKPNVNVTKASMEKSVNILSNNWQNSKKSDRYYWMHWVRL